MLEATTVCAPAMLLHELMHVCRDAARVVARLAHRCESPTLRSHCRALAGIYSSAAQDLHGALMQTHAGHAAATTVRELRRALREEPLAACRRIEGHVATVFRDALDARPSRALAELLQRHFERVLGALAELRSVG